MKFVSLVGFAYDSFKILECSFNELGQEVSFKWNLQLDDIFYAEFLWPVIMGELRAFVTSCFN